MFTLNVRTISDLISGIKKQDANPEAIVFMAASKFNYEEVVKKLSENFPSSTAIGCTTTGEISPEGIKDETISCMVFEKNYAKVNSNFLTPEIAPGEAPIKHWEKIKASNGLIINFSTGLNGGEENVLSTIETVFEKNTVELIGGTAGDNLQFKETFVSLNNEIVNNGTVGLVLNLDKSKFKMYKENIYIPTKKALQATKVDVASRTVLEFNGKKASIAYAEALGIKESVLKNVFFTNPLRT